MFEAFFMKYRYPLAYAATKVLANHIHAAVVPRARTSTRAYREAMGWHDPSPASTFTPPRSEPRQTVRADPPISRARSAYVARTRDSRPPAVKTNGGLRGSTATKWR